MSVSVGAGGVIGMVLILLYKLWDFYLFCRLVCRWWQGRGGRSIARGGWDRWMYVSRRHLQQNGSMRVEEDPATYLTSRHFDRKEVEGERSISFFSFLRCDKRGCFIVCVFLIPFGPYHRTCHFCCFTLALRVLACSLFNLHRLAVLPSFLPTQILKKEKQTWKENTTSRITIGPLLSTLYDLELLITSLSPSGRSKNHGPRQLIPVLSF